VSIDADRLNGLLERTYPTETLSDALEQIGCDVEDVVSIARYRCPNCKSMVEANLGADTVKVCTVCGHTQEESFPAIDEVTVIRLDLLAARPDLFDIGGLARALKGYLGEVRGLPRYEVGRSGRTLTIDPSVRTREGWRPYIRCAVVHVPPLDDATLATLMKMQENLHWGVGRDRKLASIGVYDLDRVNGVVSYRTIDPDRDAFEPLGMAGKPMTGRQILEQHPKGVAYAHLLADHARYPALVDESGQVLSMPPIINGDSTRVQPGSSRLFIDVTGISEAAVAHSLNMLVSSLIELGGRAESVEVRDPDGDVLVTPDLAPQSMVIELKRAKQWLGLPLTAESLVDCLERMRVDVKALGDGRFEVTYPRFRGDIRHMVDLFEDLAIGFGYANIQPAQIPSMTVSTARPEEARSEMARQAMLGLGYTEIMSLPLTTEADHYEKLRLPVPARYPRVSNPKLKALTVVRSHLMTGVLLALHENRRRPMPIRLYEMDNVVRLDDAGINGIAEARGLCFADVGPDAGYAVARATLDSVLRELGLTATYAPTDHPTFTQGRVARFTTGTAVEGVIGEVHPAVIDALGLEYPVALVDLTLCPIDFPV
jgi:phenylalanyl-tRNA synthetase beta chain